MSEVKRRDILLVGLAAMAASAATAPTPAEAGDPSFMNNVPDPLLSAKELPTFKFELEKSTGKVIGGSSGKEATVEQLPISKGIAGVSMRLEVGAMRELHWHATAAEWAFVVEGRVRTTVITPEGQAETNDFEPGDVWYFPRGHGHMLECLGSEPCHFVLIFDNGYFSEFGTFSITDWIGHAPKPLLAKNFGVPAATFDSFPKDEVYFARGAIPPERVTTPLHGLDQPPQTHKYRLLAQNPYRVFRGGRFRIETLDKGDVGYIPQGYGHSIENVGDAPVRVLIGFNTGIYQTIDLSQWIAGNPADVLATNFSQRPELFEKFPHGDVFVAAKDGPDK
jgi:oxalate decarboxylase